jgi:HEAT repeat protein
MKKMGRDDVGRDDEEMGVLRALVGDEDIRTSPAAASEPRPPAGRMQRGVRPSDVAEDEITIVTRPASTPSRPVSQLIADLQNPDPARRRSVLRSLLGQDLDIASAAAAASVLQDEDPGIRSLALRVLEGSPHLAPMDAIVAATSDREPELRARALILLGKTGNPSAAEILHRHIRSERNEGALGAALAGLASLVSGTGSVQIDGATLDRVVASVSGLAPARQFRFAESLRDIALGLPHSELESRLRSTTPDVRSGAAILCLERGSSESLQALAELRHDQDQDVRRLAALAAARVDQASGPEAPAAPQEPLERLQPIPDGTQREPEISREPVAPAPFRGAQAPAPPRRPEVPAWLREALDAPTIEDLVAAARRLVELDRADLLDQIAGSLVTFPSDRLDEAEGLREAAPWRDVAEAWRGDPDPGRRAGAVRLAAFADPDDAGVVHRGLRDPEAGVRIAAIGAVRDPARAADDLLRLAREDSAPGVRRAAIESFRSAAPEDRRAAAAAMADHPEAEIRNAAVGLLSDPATEDGAVLTRYLLDPDPGVAGRAAALLAEDRSTETLALVWGALRSAPADGRDRVIDLLSSFDRQTVTRLAVQATESTSPAERGIGLRVRAAIDGYRAFGLLTGALGDPEVEVRLAALQALGRLPSSEAIEHVGRRLGDPDAAVRADAARALAGIVDDRVLPFLLQAAGDPSDEVRTIGRAGFLSRRSVSGARSLVAALRDPARRRAAVDLLGEMGDVARELLVDWIEDVDAEAGEAAGRALAAAGAEAWLVEQLRHRRPDRRRRAVLALGAMRAVGALSALVDRLHDPDAGVRAAAATTLGAIADPRAAEPLKRAFVSDPDMGVVAAIEPALRNLMANDDIGRREP